jgi:3-hydroxyisobutyrate dehydrogenase
MSSHDSQRKPGVAVLGTGAMGSAMARNLLRAGFDVTAWNRSPEKAEALAGDGATVAGSPGAAVAAADIMLTSLFDGAAVRDVLGAAAGDLRSGAVWAEMSTLGLHDVSGLAELAGQRDVVFVDAPVQGARPLAEKGELLIYAAGPASAEPVLAPVFDVLGRRTEWLDQTGGSTAATALKLVVNGWLFALTTASAEAVALAQGLGVNPERFQAAIAGGPLDNPWAQLKSSAILEGDFSPLFAVRAAEKDADLIAEAAEAAGVRLDVGAAVRDRFRRADANGHADDDMVATYHASFDGESPARKGSPDGGVVEHA